jgi:hypothetical protein
MACPYSASKDSNPQVQTMYLYTIGKEEPHYAGVTDIQGCIDSPLDPLQETEECQRMAKTWHQMKQRCTAEKSDQKTPQSLASIEESYEQE